MMIAETATKAAKSITIIRSSKRMAPASSAPFAFHEVVNVWMRVVKTIINEAIYSTLSMTR